jgi:hypothetical protein
MARNPILTELVRTRRAIERMELERADLYTKQRELCIEGNRAGLKATEMARACRPDGRSESLAEYFRQQIRAGKAAAAKAAKARSRSASRTRKAA